MTLHQKAGSLPKNALLISMVSLGLGIIFDILFYGKLPGVSFPLYVTLVLLILLAMTRRFHARLTASMFLIATAIQFFSWMVFVRAGEFVTFLNIVMTLYLLALFTGSVFRAGIQKYVFSDYIKVVYKLLVDTVGKSYETLAEAATLGGILKKHSAVSQILRGVLITVPIAVLFILLFSSADLVFRKYMTDLFSFQLSDHLIPRTFWIAFITAGFTGVFGYLAKRPAKKAEKPSKPTDATKPRLGLLETTILFGSLNILFLSFITVQLRYLFGGEQNITRAGFTYAEYARKGFFELIAVAILSLVVIVVAEKLLLRKGQKHSARFRFLAGALATQVMIIMVSAFNRLSLYENAYGFTSLRLYSHICIVWLAVVFCFLLHKIFRDQRESTFAYLTFLSVLVLLAGINIMNADAFVARQNMDRFYVTGKLDVHYLSHLSDDGIPEAAKLLDSPDQARRDSLAQSFYRRRQDLQAKNLHWQSANISRQEALKALDAHTPLLEQNKDKQPINIYE